MSKSQLLQRTVGGGRNCSAQRALPPHFPQSKQALVSPLVKAVSYKF